MGEIPTLTFGEELRRERLIREVSLEEISASTKISVRLLTALEASNLSKLPAPVFTRGFIRAYSRHLGLDPDEMVNAYLADVAPEGAKEISPRKGRLRSRFFRGRRAAAGTIVVSVTAILLLLGLIARPQRRSGPATSVGLRAVEPVTFKNVAVSPGPAPAFENAAEIDAATALEEQAAAASLLEQTAGVSLLLEFEDDSWTEVSADGTRIFSGLIKRGSTRRFEAREGFRLTLGNAGGVRVTVDGRSLAPLGITGQVIRVRLPVPAATQS